MDLPPIAPDLLVRVRVRVDAALAESCKRPVVAVLFRGVTGRRRGVQIVASAEVEAPAAGAETTVTLSIAEGPGPAVCNTLPPRIGGTLQFAIGYIVLFDADDSSGRPVAWCPAARILDLSEDFPIDGLRRFIATDPRGMDEVTPEAIEVMLHDLASMGPGTRMVHVRRPSRSLLGMASMSADEAAEPLILERLEWPPQVF